MTPVDAMNKDTRIFADHCFDDQERDAEKRELPPEAQDAIGRKLRAHYGELVEQPLPDKFRDLLEQLAKSEKQS